MRQHACKIQLYSKLAISFKNCTVITQHYTTWQHLRVSFRMRRSDLRPKNLSGVFVTDSKDKMKNKAYAHHNKQKDTYT